MLLAAGVAVIATLEPARAAFPGNNGKIAFVREGASDSYIFTTKPNGTDTTKIPTRPRFDGTPAWSPDGRKIAFSGLLGGNWDIYVMEADGGGLKRITEGPAGDFSPSWSPDGRRLAFVRQRGEGGGSSACESCIVTTRLDGDGSKRLTGTKGFATDPAWSPDGRKIAFSKSVRGSGGEIFKMNAADGSQKRNLTDTPRAQEYEPDWSPDGKKLAYTSFTEANGAFDRVFTMNADGSEQTNLTGRDGGWSPSWSPAGGKIVFVSVHPNARSFDLFVMEADGTEVERLTATRAFEYSPTWQPLP